MVMYKTNSKGQRKSTKKRATAGMYTDFYYAYDLIDLMMKKFGDDLLPVVDEGYKAAMKVPIRQMKEWFEYVHHRTGKTIGSFDEGRTVWATRGEKLSYLYGFHKTKGGLTVIFFEYGTPRIKPEFVMYYAIHNHMGVMETIFGDTLKEILENAKKEAAPK